MSGSPSSNPEAGTPVIMLSAGWEADLVCRLRGMVSRKEPALVCIINVGGTDIILIDRRIPAGMVRFT